MTDEERAKLLAGFGKPAEPADTKEDDPWTDEEIIKSAEKLLRKIGVLNEQEHL